jgi:hypothetical protein
MTPKKKRLADRGKASLSMTIDDDEKTSDRVTNPEAKRGSNST